MRCSCGLVSILSLVTLIIADPNSPCIDLPFPASETTVSHKSCQDADFGQDQCQVTRHGSLDGCASDIVHQIMQQVPSRLLNESSLGDTAKEYSLNRKGEAGGGISMLFGGAALCFSGDVIVETREGPKRMSELKTGDEVLSSEDAMMAFSPIVMFLHRDENLLARFNVITTANGDSVKLTDDHFIYVTDCEDDDTILLRAKDVTTEHCLIVAGSRNRRLRLERVANVTKTYEVGIYAPLTSTGNIIVNNILSSCHSNLAAITIQTSFFSFYRAISSMLPKQDGRLPFGIEYLANSLGLFIPVEKFIG